MRTSNCDLSMRLGDDGKGATLVPHGYDKGRWVLSIDGGSIGVEVSMSLAQARDLLAAIRSALPAETRSEAEATT